MLMQKIKMSGHHCTVDYGLKLSASLCFFSSLFCFLVALANQGDDKAKLKTLIFASTVFFFFVASSASIEQCNFIGGKESSFAICVASVMRSCDSDIQTCQSNILLVFSGTFKRSIGKLKLRSRKALLMTPKTIS